MYGYLENKGLVATVVPGVGLCYKDKDVSSGTTGFKLVEAVANVDVPMNEYAVLMKDYSMLELPVDIVGFNNRDVTTVFMSMQAMALKFPDITINTTNGLSEILTAIPYINNNVEGMGEGWPATTGVFSLTDMGNISNTAGYSVMVKISYSMEVLKVSSKQVTVNSAILKEFGITVTKD